MKKKSKNTKNSDLKSAKNTSGSKSQKKETQKEEQTSNFGNKKIAGIIAISLFVIIFIIAIIFWRDIFPKDDVVVLDELYNGYIFYQEPSLGLWSVAFKSIRGDMQSEFYYHPQELEDLQFDENIIIAFYKIAQKKGKVFLAYDVNYSNSGLAAIAGTEIAKITGKVFLLETKSGFTEDKFNGTLPVYSCQNANSTTFVFQIMNGDENRVELINNCAIITSKSPEDALKLADLTVYHLLKIMPVRPVVNE